MKPLVVTGSQMKRDTEHGTTTGDSGYFMYSRNTMYAKIEIPRNGTYQLEVSCWSTQAHGISGEFTLSKNHQDISTHTAHGTSAKPSNVIIPVDLQRGENTIGFCFNNDAYDPDAKDPAQRDRNLCIINLKVKGPTRMEPWSFSPQHRNFFLGSPKEIGETWTKQQRDTQIKSVASHWLPTLFRRPSTNHEERRWIQRFHDIYAQTSNHELAYRTWFTSLLLAPEVWTRPRFTHPFDMDELQQRFEERIRYALWAEPLPAFSKNPSDQNFVLKNGKVSRELVTRVSEDPRIQHFIHRFFGQWLQFNELLHREIDQKAFPTFKKKWLEEMHQEELNYCFTSFKSNTKPVDFFTSIPLSPPTDQQYAWWLFSPQYKEKKKTQRHGYLSSPGFLTISSYPHRNSVVLRGKMVLENLLGEKIPPAPPTAPSFDEKELQSSGKSLEDQLKQHLIREDCRSCHERMDPIGLALQSFNPMGQLNQTSSKKDQRFKALLEQIQEQAPQVREQVLRQMWFYFTGEPIHFHIRQWAREIAKKDTSGFQDLLHATLDRMLLSMKEYSLTSQSKAN